MGAILTIPGRSDGTCGTPVMRITRQANGNGVPAQLGRHFLGTLFFVEHKFGGEDDR